MAHPPNLKLQPKPVLPPLPIDDTLWDAVVGSLALPPQLTQIVELLVRGLDNKEMIRVMGISDSTRQTYFERIAKKTGANGRTAIILLAFRVSHRLRTESGVVQNHDTLNTDKGNTDFRQRQQNPIVDVLVPISAEERK